MPVDERRCTKCNAIKPLSEFSKAPRGKYGVKASCKACDADRHAAQHVPKPRVLRPSRDLSEPKTCRKCGITKTLADFSLARKPTPTTNAVYRSQCKPCCSTRAMQWFADNPDRASAARRKSSLRKNYGIDLDEYNAMLAKQHGVCAICGEDEPNEHGRTGKKFRLSVDHCHDSGTIRGLLCQRCNRAIGLLKDDPILLRRAISYLLRSGKGVAD